MGVVVAIEFFWSNMANPAIAANRTALAPSHRPASPTTKSAGVYIKTPVL
jgi:hypothetical protein